MMAETTSGTQAGDEKELSGEITSNDTQPETAKPSLKETVETVEISTMKPNETEYTK